MPESVVSFQSLPAEYKRVILIAEQRYDIAISPLQELAGGWSGAIIYLVRVVTTGSSAVEHLILKLDRKRPRSASDEVSRHRMVQQLSPVKFTGSHIPEIAYDLVEYENVLAIFYTIAGQSLHHYRTLSNFKRQSRLIALFSATSACLLDEWNSGLRFELIKHPQELLKEWLGFRLETGSKIETFLGEVCRISPEIPGFILRGSLLPNPLTYARQPGAWGAARSLDVASGMQHGDLNTNNILAKFSRQGEELEGYYLIDFALFKEHMPLLYDLRYLEMSYLVQAIAQGSYASVEDLVIRFSDRPILDAEQTPIEMVGVNAAIQAGRSAFRDWVTENHPSLQDDLWGQYWLAGVAAGLSYCHKAGQADSVRLAGLLYASANLKLYLNLFSLPIPAEAVQLDSDSFASKPTLHLTTTGREVPNNLPAPPTNLIGRKISLAQMTALLQRPDVRLVTLTGPGGCGKTRLGLEAGKALLNHFPDGVYFIDLAQINDPALVATTTAHTIGIRQGGGLPPLESLIDYLAGREMLLIFDNFEQVSAAAGDVSKLLSATQGVNGLITSRIPLRLRWEHEYQVSPLDMPPDGQHSLAETLEYESVALFQQQARAVRPGFEITADNCDAVVDICRRLDGLPLAIEIAAARIKMLEPETLQKRLDHSLNILVGGAKDLPERQQTMRKTIDWSYQLLNPEERELFIRLGVFAGGFNLAAAEEVCLPSGESDIYTLFESLVNSSLLRPVRSVIEEPRFDMLNTIREYALEKAEDAGIVEDLGFAHCDYYARLAQVSPDGGVYGAESNMWLQRFDEEHDNFRAALNWALEHPERGVQPLLMMMGQLTWFWYRYGYLQEGSEWTQRFLVASDDMGESISRASALTGRAYLALWSGDLVVSARLGKEAVEMCQRMDFEYGLSMSKLCYGTALINLGRDLDAYPHLVDAVELYDQQDQPWMKGTTLVHLANVSLGLGNPDQATRWLDMAMPYLKETGDIWSMAFGLNNYGEVARTQGDYERAEKYYRRTEELFKHADAKGDQARLVHTFGYIALHKGEFSQARILFLESLKDFRELGNHRGIAECLAGLAGLACEQGNCQWAAPLLSAAESQLKAFGGAWWPADRVEIERAKSCIQAALGEKFEKLWLQGQSMSVDTAIRYAMNGEI